MSTVHSVHPHACGENHGIQRLSVELVRYTPTRVGKTVFKGFWR